MTCLRIVAIIVLYLIAMSVELEAFGGEPHPEPVDVERTHATATTDLHERPMPGRIGFETKGACDE